VLKRLVFPWPKVQPFGGRSLLTVENPVNNAAGPGD